MNASTPEQRLADLGIELPQPFKPIGAYASVRCHQGLAFAAGHGRAGMDPSVTVVGKLGEHLTVEQGKVAAASLDSTSCQRWAIVVDWRNRRKPLGCPSSLGLMAVQTSSLTRAQDLDDSSKTRGLEGPDLDALRSVVNWIKTFVAMPNKDLGRGGPVCPFVGKAMDRGTLWLAPERIADRGVADAVRLVNDYKGRLLRADPLQGDDIAFKAILVVFTDVSADHANDVLSDPQIAKLLKPAYAQDGVVIGEFHERNDGGAVYNSAFHPFMSPVPFVLLRHANISDWKFFVDDDDWLGIWARRFPESAVPALAGELRRTNWRHIES